MTDCNTLWAFLYGNFLIGTGVIAVAQGAGPHARSKWGSPREGNRHHAAEGRYAH